MAVAVLNKEVMWSTHMVKVVVMTSLCDEKTEEIQKFYDITSKFLSDKSAVLKLIANPDFNNFISLLCELGTERRK